MLPAEDYTSPVGESALSAVICVHARVIVVALRHCNGHHGLSEAKHDSSVSKIYRFSIKKSGTCAKVDLVLC